MRFRLTILLLGFAVYAGERAEAQSLTVNGGGSATLRAASDYATEVIGDPWDFEQRSDFVYMFSDDAHGQLSGFASLPDVSDGLLRGVINNNNAPGRGHLQVSLLFEGITGALNDPGKNGVKYPIDTSRYNRVSFRMKRSIAPTPGSENLIGVYWRRRLNRGAAGQRLADVLTPHPTEGHTNQSPIADQAKTTYHIYTLDLDRGRLDGLPWTGGDGFMGALELRASLQAAMANAAIEIDWARLIPRGQVQAGLAWTGFGGRVTLTASNAQTGDLIQIYPGGGPGVDFPASGSLQWDYGFLPAGTWTLTARAGSQTRTATLNIDAAPIIHITEPDASGGTDFATATFADAWDLTNIQDVARHGRVWDIAAFNVGELGLDGVTNGIDPFVQLAGHTPGPKIPAEMFHRLTFTIQHDNPHWTAHDALSDGAGITRVIWNRDHMFRESQDLFVLDGMPTTYSIDLSTLDDTNTEVEPGPGPLWSGAMDLLRIDIHESTRPHGFRLSNVKLATDDAPNGNGFFIIKWHATDATFSRQIPNGNAADATVSLFYDTDLNPAGRVAIASGIPASEGHYAWDVSGLTPNVPYYVHAEITDASGNSQSRYSTGPVRVTVSYPAGFRTDSNSNGLPDQWEATHVVTSASQDADGDGLNNLDEYRAGTNPRLSNVWNMSEGSTGFFTQRIALANPDAAPADIRVTYLRAGGRPPVTRDYTVLPFGRLTINVNEVAGVEEAAVSAVITTLSGGVVAERTMFWGDLWYGGHTGKAIQDARQEWFLAEGTQNAVFSTYILLANATPTPANVALTFLRQNDAPVVVPVGVGASSRVTVDAAQIPELQGFSFSTRVTSDVPISVERSMYINTSGRLFEGGHEAAAVPSARTDWYIAEGQTGDFFAMFVLLANPNPTPTTATLRYLMPNRAPVTTVLNLGANSRTTVQVGNQNWTPGVQHTDVSVEVKATDPIVVERAMYWPANGTWTDGHASAGVNELGTQWAMAEGESGGSRGFESYILFANPSNADARVRLTFLREGGRPPVSSDFVVSANQRLTRSAGEFIAAGLLQPGEKFGVVVTSLDNVPIVIERAMYWNGGGEFWGGGTNETGFRLR